MKTIVIMSLAILLITVPAIELQAMSIPSEGTSYGDEGCKAVGIGENLGVTGFVLAIAGIGALAAGAIIYIDGNHENDNAGARWTNTGLGLVVVGTILISTAF